MISVPEGTGAAATSDVVNLVPDQTRVCFIEVPAGKEVRYEIQPQGPTAPGARVAGNASRKLGGIQPVKWNAGFTISLTDAAFYT